MTLYSAIEDLASRTLAALPGRFSRLLYLAGLRHSHGGYSHWGLNRVHGEQEMQRAVQEAHQRLFADVLQTPLQDLHSEVSRPGKVGTESPERVLSDLQARESELIAPGAGPESRSHFNSVLLALAHLIQAKNAPTRRAS